MATYNYSTDTAWGNWNDSTSVTTVSNYAWASWTITSSPGTTATSSDTVWYTWSATVEETREQKRARLAQQEIDQIESNRKIKEMEDRNRQAEITAQDLLKDLISEEEMKTYQETGFLLVKGNKHDYVLKKGFQTDVIQVEKGKVVQLSGKIKGRSYCVHPVDQHRLPDTDKIIAMKIALESEESRIMKMANARGDREFNLAVNS